MPGVRTGESGSEARFAYRFPQAPGPNDLSEDGPLHDLAGLSVDPPNHRDSLTIGYPEPELLGFHVSCP